MSICFASREINPKTKVIFIAVALIAIAYGLIAYTGREQAVGLQVQRKIEATIPECQERDRIADSFKEIEPGAYLANDIEQILCSCGSALCCVCEKTK